MPVFQLRGFKTTMNVSQNAFIAYRTGNKDEWKWLEKHTDFRRANTTSSQWLFIGRRDYCQHGGFSSTVPWPLQPGQHITYCGSFSHIALFAEEPNSIILRSSRSHIAKRLLGQTFKRSIFHGFIPTKRTERMGTMTSHWAAHHVALCWNILTSICSYKQRDISHLHRVLYMSYYVIQSVRKSYWDNIAFL
jgi:hypothetical protein